MSVGPMDGLSGSAAGGPLSPVANTPTAPTDSMQPAAIAGSVEDAGVVAAGRAEHDPSGGDADGRSHWEYPSPAEPQPEPRPADHPTDPDVSRDRGAHVDLFG